MRNKLLALLITALTLAFIQPLALAAVKPGTACKVLGKTSTSSGIKYTCVKSGKKLVWNKGVAAKKPAPVATPTPTPTPTPSATPTPTPTPLPTASATPTPTPTPTVWRDPLQGTPCAVEYATMPNQIFELTCLKDSVGNPGSTDNRLYWFQNNPPTGGVPTPTPTPTPTPVTLPVLSLDSEFAAIADCKLRKPSNLTMDDGPMGSVGFPMNPNDFSSIGNLKGLVILTDFSDVVATSELRDVWTNSTIPLAEKLFPYASYGKLNLKIDLTSKIYRLQKPSTYYNLISAPYGGPIENGPAPKLDEVIFDGMKAADIDFDLSQYAFIAVAAPRSPSLTLSGAQGLGRISTPLDGKIFVLGDFVPLDGITPLDKPYKTLNFTHDIGHMLGLMHPYDVYGRSMGAWDIMQSFAFQNDFLGWNKWKLNWITDNQVSCVPAESKMGFTQFLSPIGDIRDDKKMIVIKLSATQALAVEVRRKSPFEDLQSSDEGVIVYKVDTTKGSGSGPYTIVSNPRKMVNYQGIDLVLGTMKPGESVTESGYTISVLQSTSDGDYILVKRNG